MTHLIPRFSIASWLRPLLLALAAAGALNAGTARADDIGGFGFVPRFGTANYFSTTALTDTPGTVARHNFQIELGLDFGGKGFHFELTPYYLAPDFNGSGLQGAGLGIGFLGRFGLIDRLYMSIGFSWRSAVLFGSSAYGLGAESYTRLPIEFTYYVIDELGIVAQISPGYGVSGAVNVINDEFGIGRGWLLDWGVGIRVP
jgi:hypothetical protein